MIERLKQFANTQPDIGSVWILNAQGDAIVSSLFFPLPPTANGPERAYLKGQLARGPDLHIGEVQRTASPVEPLTVVRYVVLAKASSLAGAIFAGFFTAVVIWLLGQPRGSGSHPGADLPPALGCLGGAIVLLIGALLLERACRVPPQPDEDDESE
jgi:hypothetical protein